VFSQKVELELQKVTAENTWSGCQIRSYCRHETMQCCEEHALATQPSGKSAYPKHIFLEPRAGRQQPRCHHARHLRRSSNREDNGVDRAQCSGSQSPSRGKTQFEADALSSTPGVHLPSCL
jgi:hypothetical protein